MSRGGFLCREQLPLYGSRSNGFAQCFVYLSQRLAGLQRLNGLVGLVVIGFHLFLYLCHLLGLAAYGGYHLLAFEVGGVHFLGGRTAYTTRTLTFARKTCGYTRVFFGLDVGGTVVGLRIQNGITNFSDRLTAAGTQTHAHSYLTHFIERHTLELL